jgi:thiol-disulfide isomerase/thioredoxin
MNPTRIPNSLNRCARLGLFFLAGLGIFSGCGSTPRNIHAPNFTLTDLNGKKFSLSEFKGKVVFLEFWATWCGPCIISMPNVEKLSEEFKGKKIEFLSLSLDQDENAVREFSRERQLKNRIAMIGESGVDQRYGISSIPAFFIIDQRGDVKGAWAGYAPQLPMLWRNVLKQLLDAA